MQHYALQPTLFLDEDKDEETEVNKEILRAILKVAQDTRAILKNQENFHIRLTALEAAGNAAANMDSERVVNLPITCVQDFNEEEEVVKTNPAARKQLVGTISKHCYSYINIVTFLGSFIIASGRQQAIRNCCANAEVSNDS